MHSPDSEHTVTAYSIYSVKAKEKTKVNPLENLYPPFPKKKYSIIYADPPWDYGGKMQYNKSIIKSENKDFKKNIFISSASFKYPTIKLQELKTLDIESISDSDCLLFLWTTGPQFANSIELGKAWGLNTKQLLLYGIK